MKHLLLKTWVVMLCLLAGVGTTWAETVNFTLGSGKEISSNSGATKSGITITAIDGTSTANNWGTASYVKLQAGGSFVITPSSATITSIVLTCNSGYEKTWSASTGSAPVVNTTVHTVTWSGSTTSAITLTNTASAQARVSSIDVTYTPSGGSSEPVNATWSVAPSSVSVSASKTANATITTNYDGTLSVSSANSSIATATIKGKVITVTGVAAGNTTLNVTGAATSSYNAINKTINVTVTADARPENEIFYESFDTNDGTGGNDDKWSGSIATNDLKSDNENWTFVKGNGANECAKFGTGSALGSATTPALGQACSATLTFKAAAWNGSSESTTLKLSVIGGGTVSPATVTMTKGAWKDFEVTLTNLTANSKIKFEGNATSNSRFFLDEVSIVKTGGDAPEPEKTLVSIAASGTAADLWTADEFSHEGVTITATWDDETQTDVTSSCSFSGYDMTTAGTQTVTATYQGQTCTYSVTVNTIANTQETAYTTTQAIALIDAGKGLKEKVYVAGTVSKVDSYNSTYGSITYWLDENSFEIYGGLAQGGAKFSSKDDIQAEAEVVVLGVIKKYSSTYEMDKDNVLVSYTASTPKQTATISAPGAKTTMMIGDVDDEYTVSYDGDGALSVESSNSAVATVTIDGSEVSVHAVGKGTATITISAPATENYYAASYNYTLTVSKRADLPFSFSGGRSDIATTDGMSQDGLGSDYSTAPKLKFDGTNDEVVINYTGEAGVLQYTIKGNTFDGSTFDVMESANGTDYTSVKTYTELPTTLTESRPLSADTRFVKFVYTDKVGGNVALGNIKIFAGHVRNVETGDYGTICLPYAVTAPVGATFYTVSNINNETGSITLSEAVSSLEAGTPYIFQATKDDVVCEYTGDAVASPVADTYLTGVFVATPAPADSYVLQNQSGVVGFYKVGSTIPTVGAYRAYLTVPGSNARVLTFGDETAISNIKVENNSNNVIYNMAGQRVNKAEKGIFIINGKKVIK